MTTNISSNSNKIYKLCVALAEKKNREKYGKYLIEGQNLLEEAVKNRFQIESILIASSKYDKFKIWSERINSYILDDQLFQRIASTETSQGIIAILNVHKTSEEKFLANLKKEDNILILDRLQDPGNIGTIIRTADAAGYKGIIAIKGTCDIFSPKILRATTGSIFRIPLLFIDDYEQLIKVIRSSEKKLVVSALENAECYYDVNLSKGIALVIGNEGNGVAEELIRISDIKVKIPMEGNIESLNASIAASILMYERIRK